MTRARDVANLIGSGNYSSTTFTATAGQTVFSIAHTQNFVQVFMNGLLLDLTVDYTSNGSAVTLTSGAAAGDEIEVVAYNTFSVGDALNQAAADTRYVNTAGDSMTGTLVAGTRLQVGDSSITNAYSGNAALGYIADFQGSSGSQTFVSIAAPNASSLGDNGIVIGEDASNTYITQRGNKPINLACNGQTRLKIDGSGRITTPYQPMFSYLGSKSHVISTTGDQVMSSSNVWSASVNHALNRGSHFNASNGRFTAPVTGTYALYFRCQASNLTSGYLWFYFKVNGSAKSYAQKSQEAALTAMTHHMIFELSASDYVTSEWTNNYVSGQIHYPSFSGHLIG